MNIYETVLSKVAQRAEKLDGDYYKDGFLYCGKCNTPKEMEMEFTWTDKPIIVKKSCACMIAEEEKEKERERIEKRKMRISESMAPLLEMGVARMPKCNFSMCDDSNPELKQRMMKYAKNFDAVYDRNIGLILYGNTGAGKTFFAECIASELLKNGRFALLTSVSSIVNAMSGNYSNNIPQIMNYVKNVDLLILDDFGAERETSYMSEHLFNIIDARYVAKRPMIVTTNIDTTAMMANSNIRIKRIGERLAESCVAIEVKGTSRRIDKAKEKVSQLKDIFEE